MDKYADSYDNECFAPQYWEEYECTNFLTQTLTENS